MPAADPPEATDGRRALAASARSVGIATIDADGRLLDIWYPAPELSADAADSRVGPVSGRRAISKSGIDLAAMAGHDPVRDVHRVVTEVAVGDLEAPIGNLYDAYLRLHLLSHRLVKPNQISVEGLLEMVDHDVAWTSLGPCRAGALDDVAMRAGAARMPFEVKGIFPVPPMLDYVRPSGVAIADARRVLLGAHLAAGTVVTPAGFCGMNAGTLGPCMIEGRISAGIRVGSGCHIGGGASLMGVLSGGGRLRVSIGERCLLGANSGVGIPLGDECIVEAGCYVTAGAPVTLPDGGVVKARELAGRPRLIFRRNAQTGTLEAIENGGRWTGLNPLIHPTGL